MYDDMRRIGIEALLLCVTVELGFGCIIELFFYLECWELDMWVAKPMTKRTGTMLMCTVTKRATCSACIWDAFLLQYSVSTNRIYAVKT